MSNFMAKVTLLFLGRSPQIAELFPRFKQAEIEVGLADNLQGALAFIDKSKPSLLFSQASFPGYRAETLLKEHAHQPGFPPVIVYTSQGTATEAQKLMELGAKDYWLAPLTWEKIQTVLPAEPREETMQAGSKPRAKTRQILAEDRAMRRVLALANQVASSRATVLISGESGTGKEMVARYIHRQSSRSEKPFVAINCAALPEHLLESELFGHEKGAFTGAITRKPGRFELASGGTILLDEISEMDLGLQAKLLRVLQEGEIDRVGGTETISVDVRVLATTNRNLEEHVQEGHFRQDLYYRLNVIPLTIPPLRERKDDILPLAQHFVQRYCREYGMRGSSFSPEAQQWVREYEWPGNVRELQNLMERAVLLAGAGPIGTKHFLLGAEEWLEEENLEKPETSAEERQQLSEEQLALMPLHEMEKKMIMKSLDHTSGNRTQAAHLLGISVRTLRNKLNEYRKEGDLIP